MNPVKLNPVAALLAPLALLFASAAPTHAAKNRPPSPNHKHCEGQLNAPQATTATSANILALEQWQHEAKELAAASQTPAAPRILSGALIIDRNAQLTKLVSILSHQELLAQAALTIIELETNDPNHQYLPGLLPGITYSNNLTGLIQNYLDIQKQVLSGDLSATTPDLQNVLGNLLTPINITLSALKNQTNERIIVKCYGIYLERALATAILVELQHRLNTEPAAILHSLK